MYAFEVFVSCFKSGFGRVGIILLDSNPHPVQSKIKLNFTGTYRSFCKKFKNLSQNIENSDNHDADEKE